MGFADRLDMGDVGAVDEQEKEPRTWTSLVEKKSSFNTRYLGLIPDQGNNIL